MMKTMHELTHRFQNALRLTDDSKDLRVRPGDNDGQVIFDPLSGWENGLGLAGCFSFVVMCGVGYEALTSEKGVPAEIMGSLVFLFLALLTLRFNLDEHYLFDFNRRELTFHRSLFGVKSRKLFAAFSEFHSIGVDGHLRSRGAWFYAVKLVTQRGETLLLRLSERRDFKMAQEMAQAMSEVLELPCLPEPEAKKHLHYQLSRDGRIQEITYLDHDQWLTERQ